jgi:MFS family permease
VYISFSDRTTTDQPAPESSSAAEVRDSGASLDGTVASRAPRATTRVSSVVISLGIVSMFTDISSESVSAILPLYITGVIGLSTVAYGFLDGLYQGVSAVVRIAGGWAADRGDTPKWVAFFGYGISAIARVGLLFATGFGALAAVVTADRLGKGIRTAPRDSLIASSSTSHNLGRSFGVHRMLDTVGAAIGPLLAFAILFFIPNGYSTIFVVSLTFAILGVLVLGILVPNKRPIAERTGTGPVRPVFRWRQLADPRLRRVLLAAGVLGVLTVGDGFIYLVLQSRDAFAATWFPLLYVGTNVAFLVLAIPLGRLADRFGRARVFVLGHVALLATYLCAAIPGTGLATTVACLVLLGAFYAATDGILAALTAECTAEGSRASGIAAAQTVVALGRLIASTGFGLLWFTAGRGPAMFIVAIALAVAVPLAVVLLRPLLLKEPAL